MTLSDRPADLASPRSTLRRKRERGAHDRAAIDAILDEGLVCHVGIAAGHDGSAGGHDGIAGGHDGIAGGPDGAEGRGGRGVGGEPRPLVLPTAYGREGDTIYLHGAAGNGLLRALAGGAEACLTVTLIDGLVLARSAFHHSLNYRSVVLFGHAERVDDEDEKRRALDAIVEHLVPGRTADARPPTAAELRSTLVVRFPIVEGSAKVRSGPPLDLDDDLRLAVWAGVVPFATVAGAAVADGAGAVVDAPGYVTSYRRPA